MRRKSQEGVRGNLQQAVLFLNQTATAACRVSERRAPDDAVAFFGNHATLPGRHADSLTGFPQETWTLLLSSRQGFAATFAGSHSSRSAFAPVALARNFDRLREDEPAASCAKGKSELHRLAHKPIRLTTPFQLLKWFSGFPRWEIGVSEAVGGLFVFHEIHAYHSHVTALIAQMVEVLRRLDGRFLFLSATLRRFLKGLLQGAPYPEVPSFALESKDNCSQRVLSQARHLLRGREASLQDVLREILAAPRQGRRTLILANRVTQTQHR